MKLYEMENGVIYSPEGGKPDEELKTVWRMFTDAWKFYKKYADVKQSDEYRESVVEVFSGMSQHCGDTKADWHIKGGNI